MFIRNYDLQGRKIIDLENKKKELERIHQEKLKETQEQQELKIKSEREFQIQKNASSEKR